MTKAWTMSTVVRLFTGTTTMTFTWWILLIWTTHVKSEKDTSWRCLGRFLLDIVLPDILRKNIDDRKNHCQVHQHLHFHHLFHRSNHQYLASPTTIAESRVQAMQSISATIADRKKSNRCFIIYGMRRIHWSFRKEQKVAEWSATQVSKWGDVFLCPIGHEKSARSWEG